MIWNIAIHRSHDTNIVDALAEFRKEAAYLDPTLSILLKRKRRLHQGPCLMNISRSDDPVLPTWFRRAMKFLKRRLWIECIHL